MEINRNKEQSDRDNRKNRFTRLRYKDNATLTDAPLIKPIDLAKKLGLSKATISNVENADTREYDAKTKNHGDVPHCNAQTLKAYHDYFDCSYEYLMGETASKERKYYDLGRDPQLSVLGDDFWNNLKSVLKDEYGEAYIYQYMLTLIFSNPEELKGILKSLYIALFSLHQIRSEKLSVSAEVSLQAPHLFSAEQSFLRYLSEVLLPLVNDYGFSPYCNANLSDAENTEALLSNTSSEKD